MPSTPLTAARRNSWATQDPRSLPLPSAAAAPAADVPAAAGAGVVAVGDSKAEQAPASQRTERKRSVEGKRNPRGSPRAAGRSPPSDGSSSSASSSSAEAASGSLSPRPLSQNAHYIKADVHVTKSPLSASGSVSATDSNVFIGTRRASARSVLCCPVTCVLYTVRRLLPAEPGPAVPDQHRRGRGQQQAHRGV